MPSPGLPGTRGAARQTSRGARAQPVPPVVGAAQAAARDRQRRWFRGRLVRRRGSGTRAVPAYGPHLGRPVLRRPGAGGALGCAARRGARRDRGGRRRGGRGSAVRRGPLAVQPQRRDQRLATLPGPARADPAARRTPVTGGALRLGPRLGDDPEPAARQATRKGRRSPTRSWTSRPPRPARGSTSFSPTARRSPRPPGATPSGT